jgi:hypothetical protein
MNLDIQHGNEKEAVLKNPFLNYLLTEVETVLGTCHGIGLGYAVYVSTKRAASFISA